MNQTVLRSRPLSFRSGYPLSSEEINEGFDNLIYDLCKILDTPLPDTMSGDIHDYLNIMKRCGEQTSMDLLGHESEVSNIVGGYTKDWRRL